MKLTKFQEWLQRRLQRDNPRVKIAGRPVRPLPTDRPEPRKTVDGVHDYKPMADLPPGL